jgi:hypothetical protein
MHSRYRIALAALALLALSTAPPAAAAQDPSQPIPADDPACQVANPPRVCLVDDHRQYQGSSVCSASLPGSGGYLFQGVAAGQRNSAPLLLDGGAYLATWDATDTTALSYIDLEPSDDANGLRSYSILAPSGAAASRAGQSYVYKVKPGSYYVSARVTGPWSVRLIPVALTTP